jgi:hypothetical protein
VSGPARETLLLIAASVAGAIVVALVLFADSILGTPGWVDYTDERRDALETSGWSIWVVLVVAQGALWGVLLPLVVRLHDRLQAEWNVKDLTVTLLPLAGLSVVIDVVRYATQVKSPLPGHYGKITIVTWLGTLTALVAVAGIVRVGRAAWSLRAEGRAAAALETYLQLRSHLRQFLMIAGAAVAGASLSAGALQNAVEGYRGESARPAAVLFYGLFLSLLLLVVYAPAFDAVRKAGERILDELEPRPASDQTDWPLGSERRGELRAFLQLDAGLMDSLRVGVAVFAPLTSGLVSLLLPD